MIALLLADGFEEVEAITPADFLRRAGVEVRLVGIGGSVVTGGHGIAVTADTTIDEISEIPDGIIVPGGMPGAENVAASEKALELIRNTFDAGKLVAAICAAPAVVLQKAGVLTGRKVTCYPGFESRLDGCDFSAERVVIDGNLITSRGPGTAAEFAVKLVETLVGAEAASDIHRKTLQK